MKVLTIWLWAFGFAINKLLWENNKNNTFYVYEVNKTITENIEKTREHPFFFKWYKLSENVEIIYDIEKIIFEIDLLIIALPAQFISTTISWLKGKLKPWITILNLSKWIDIISNNPVSRLIWEKLDWLNFNYCVLSWWMIAMELVEWKYLWADLWINDFVLWEKIKKLFENHDFQIVLRKDILNIELYGSLKNIMAILCWYYEWLWYGQSSIWAKLVEYYSEIWEIIELYGWNKKLDFSYYSLWWDIVATCFWNSRNRYLGNLLWSWKNIKEALEILKSENKHSEWYETLKVVYEMIKDKEWFKISKYLYNLI
jgi:glycerol-3-phosphate dehydrogenase (NAD(P)+)